MAEQSKISPPYMSWGVFKSAIDQLAENTVPTGPLDRRVLDRFSGADHGALISGLRFLGYVDDDRRATESYRNLVAASTNQTKFRELLMGVIGDKYDPIIRTVDMESGTAFEVEKAFRAYGVPAGQMLTKTIRFYIKALQECGITVSNHITKPKPRAPRNGAKKSSKGNGRGSEVRVRQELPGAPKGFDRMPVPGLRDAFIQFPLDLTPEQVDLFGAVVNVLKTFAKGKSGKGESDQ